MLILTPSRSDLRITIIAERELRQPHRGRFAVDLVRAVQASAELGRWSVLAQELGEWKSTAAICAQPGLVEELTRLTDDDLGVVPAPEAG